MNYLAYGAAAIGLLAFAPATHAGPVTFNASVGGVSNAANPQYFHFDALPAGVTTTFSGDGGVVTGSTVAGDPPPGHAAPYLSNNQGTVFAVSPANGPQTSPYLSTGIGSATIALPGPQTYFGLLIGSEDNYNSVAFENGGSMVQSFASIDLFTNPTGDRGAAGTEWFNFSSTAPFDSVVLSSSQYALEAGAGALAGPQPISEPRSAAMLAVSLLGLGLAINYREKRRRQLERCSPSIA